MSDKPSYYNHIHYEQLTDILNSSKQMINICNKNDYKLIYCNNAAMSEFGIDCENYSGRTCHDLLFGLQKPCDFCPISKMHEDSTEVSSTVDLNGKSYDVFIKKARLNDEEVYIKYVEDVTEIQQSLRSTGEFLETVNDLVGLGMWYYTFNDEGKPDKLYLSDIFKRIIGYDEETNEIGDMDSFNALVHNEDRPAVMAMTEKAIRSDQKHEMRFRIRKKDNSYVWVHSYGKCLKYPDGRPRILLGVLSDINGLKHEEELSLIIQAVTSEYLNIYLVNVDNRTIEVQKQDGVLVIEGENGSTNEYPYDAAWHKYVYSTAHPEDADDLYRAGSFENVLKELTTKNEYTYNYRTVNKGLRHFMFKYIRLDENRIVAAFRNIDDIMQLRESSRMLKKIERDILTGLYNKESFNAYVRRLLDSSEETAYDMVCFEVESYRMLYRRYGAENLDSIIKIVSYCLRELAPSEVIMGRIDDDQFALLMPHLPQELHIELFNRFFSMFSSRSSLPNIIVNAGVYMNIDPTLELTTCINNARLPIAGVRDYYSECIAFFDDNLKQEMVREVQIKASAKDGIEKEQFKVYYQPKHSAFDESVTGAEALVRWIHPDFGFISPGDFIPIFEKNGFISRVDRYVLEKVCINLAENIKAGRKVVPTSINISQVDFDRLDLPEKICEIVDRYSIPHNLLHFEVTESVHARDIFRRSEAIRKLKSYGFSIDLDDFGAGYSNLSTLADEPVDVMKLDISLVRDMVSPNHRTVLQSIIYAAHGLGISVVAEGVETREQLEILKSFCKDNVDLHIQGFYYSKPLPYDDYLNYIAEK